MASDHYSFAVDVNPDQSHGDIALLFSGEGRPRGGHNIGPAVHPYVLIHTVAAGRGVYEIRGNRYECGAGDTFFIFPGELFRYEADKDDPWHYVWVAFQGHRSEPLLAGLGIDADHAVLSLDAPLLRKALRCYRHMRAGLRQTAYPQLANLEASAWLRLLLHEFGHANRLRLPSRHASDSPAERLVDQAVRWLSLQYAQRVSIDQLAKSLGYHRTHLSKLFKQRVGLSPMQFLMQVRLEQAKALLRSRWTIEQVASSVGFADALYFSKQFRKVYGMSPSEFRSHGQEQRDSSGKFP